MSSSPSGEGIGRTRDQIDDLDALAAGIGDEVIGLSKACAEWPNSTSRHESSAQPGDTV